MFTDSAIFLCLHLHYSLQGLALEILVYFGIVKSNHFWLDVEHLQEALQNALVIIEMVFFSLFQQYAYSVEPYQKEATVPDPANKKNEWASSSSNIMYGLFFFWLTFAHSSLLDFINATVSCFEPIVRNNNKK